MRVCLSSVGVMKDASEQQSLIPPVTDVVVDVPGWQRVKARIPDTPQRRKLEEQRSVREIVFGMQDGILTTLGIVTGVGSAAGSRTFVLIGGFISLLAGALAMGAGEYLGARSEREVVQAAIDMEKAEMAADPQAEFAEQVAYYKLKGFSAEEAQMIVSRLAQHPDIYLYEMMRDEFGIDPREAEGKSLRGPLAMSASFAFGAVLPILAFFLPLPLITCGIIGAVIAVIGLFGVGFYAGTLGTRHPVAKGFEVALVGIVIFAVSYLAGHYIPPLFGIQPISAGG